MEGTPRREYETFGGVVLKLRDAKKSSCVVAEMLLLFTRFDPRVKVCVRERHFDPLSAVASFLGLDAWMLATFRVSRDETSMWSMMSFVRCVDCVYARRRYLRGV